MKYLNVICSEMNRHIVVAYDVSAYYGQEYRAITHLECPCQNICSKFCKFVMCPTLNQFSANYTANKV